MKTPFSPVRLSQQLAFQKRCITVFRDVKSMRSFVLDKKTNAGQNVGFVPTMGCLHSGHLHLCSMAKKKSDIVVASIFVNPAQFAPHEDLDKYPRQLEADIQMLSQLGVVDAVFAPTVDEMYPSGVVLDTQKQVGAFVEVKGLSHQLEGQVRPHFFRGVATVVTKLFMAVQPDVAVFGQKDVQQCVVIRRLVKDLLMPIEVLVAPTVRESDGLAMSSRNRYLSPSERSIAPIIHQALQSAHNHIITSGKRENASCSSEEVKQVFLNELKREPTVSLDYISIASRDTLAELDSVSATSGAIMSATIRVGTTRLLDNVIIGHEGGEYDFIDI